MRNRRFVILLWMGLTLLLVAPAWALINPNFTPIHLAEESELILAARCQSKQVTDRVVLKPVEAIKGKAPPSLVIDLTKATKQHADFARRQFASAVGQLAVLFAGKYQSHQGGYLHVRGVWMQLARGPAGEWQFQAIDEVMPGTWAGGTDMLLRCVRYVLAEGADAFVPVESGTAWRSVVKAGSVKGKVTAVSAVNVSGDGGLWLHVAGPGGDRLFRPLRGEEGFEDVTAAVKLAAASVACAWGDFNADGRVDLASFDGKALTIWRQGPDGTFGGVKASGRFALPADCPGMEPVGLGRAAAPGLIVGTRTGPPLLLAPTGQAGFAARSLPKADPGSAKWGKAQGCLVADFTNDGRPDVLRPFEKDGLLYAGDPGGAFRAPVACGVHSGPGGGRAAAGDFDADGWLDVLVAGAEGVKIFQNLKNGTFAETVALSGEISYKAQPFASWCGVCDFNNDARQDVFITYEGEPLLLYFNRGFRSFGQAPRLELGLGEIADLASGQQAGVFADFDGDGAQDLAVALAGGEVWCAYNDLGGEGALCIAAGLPAAAAHPGLITVTVWARKRCLGAAQARVGAPPAFFGVREAGAYVVKWRFPGEAWQERSVIVEDGPVRVLLEGADAPTQSRPAGAEATSSGMSDPRE